MTNWCAQCGNKGCPACGRGRKVGGGEESSRAGIDESGESPLFEEVIEGIVDVIGSVVGSIAGDD